MQGVFVDGRRAPTKKALKEAIASDPSRVSLEATSVFGNEYDGRLDEAPDGEFSIVGPDPYRQRNWYGTIRVAAGQVTVK